MAAAPPEDAPYAVITGRSPQFWNDRADIVREALRVHNGRRLIAYHIIAGERRDFEELARICSVPITFLEIEQEQLEPLYANSVCVFYASSDEDSTGNRTHRVMNLASRLDRQVYVIHC